MNSLELRASLSLAFLYSLRLMGLFLILPVFAVHAASMPGAVDATWVGLALGAYGLTQGVLQIPFGLASDHFGRKRVIAIGMVIFALGSLVAALATTVQGVTIGRALQGAGAVSGAITALLADSTRDSQRTKAMALIGISIGLTFAVCLVIAPLLYARIGMSGIFHFTTGSILVGLLVLWLVVPSVQAPKPTKFTWSLFMETVIDPQLWRLNMGNFILQAVLMSIFVVIPGQLVKFVGMPIEQHWKVYLPVILLSMLLMAGPLWWAERRGATRLIFNGSIAWLILTCLGFAFQPSGLVLMAGLLVAFFIGFNVLEASLPSLVSRLAPATHKGLALGIYNTLQALGLFCGAAVGGLIAKYGGDAAVFIVGAVALAAWLSFSIGAKRWALAS